MNHHVLRPLGVVALLVALAGCTSAPQASVAPAQPPAAISTAVATLVEQGSVEVLPGTVKAATAATLMARVPGVVGRIAATPGTMVVAGAVLVELDAQELAARRDQAQAIATQAAADVQRLTPLLERQSTSQAEYDAAKARAAGSAAAAAEAGIMVGYTRLTAPFAGVVVRKHVEIGDLLSPGRPVIELEDPTSLRLEVEVPETLAARVALGTSLRVQLVAAALDQPAAVVEVSPAFDPVSRSVLVKLALPPTATGLRSGQFGRVTIPVSGGAQLSVPSAAIVRRGQLDAVFVIADGVAHLRLVRLGGSTADRTAIRAGLGADEVVAVDGATTLRDGQRVTVR